MDTGIPQEQGHTRRVATPYLRRIITEFYRTAVTDYRLSGCPFGDSISGMIIWFEFGQGTTVN